MLDQRILRLQIEDIVFHDPRGRDDDRLGAHRLGRRAVLDDLGEFRALDDDALGQGDGLPRLERFGRLAALVAQHAPKIGRIMNCASHKVGPALAQGLFERDRIREEEVGRGDAVERLPGDEIEEREMVARRAVNV